ncbi:MAG: hypothetical protein ABI980_09005 [Nitrospirota bacterium]
MTAELSTYLLQGIDHQHNATATNPPPSPCNRLNGLLARIVHKHDIAHVLAIQGLRHNAGFVAFHEHAIDHRLGMETIAGQHVQGCTDRKAETERLRIVGA